MTLVFELLSLLMLISAAMYSIWLTVKTSSRWPVLPAIFLFLLTLNQVAQYYYVRLITEYIQVEIPYWTHAPQSITNLMAGLVVLFLLIHLRNTHVNRTLLQEMHHRIKNNLQVVSSLLGLQATQSEHEEVKEVFSEARDRIQSVALLHDQLTGHVGNRVQFDDYARRLMRHLNASNDSLTDWSVNMEEVSLPMETALPSGLILNELVTNAIQHGTGEAQPPDGLEVEVSMHRDGNGAYQLRVKDNGVGFPSDINLHDTDSFGLNMVVSLTEGELDGSLDVLRNGGTTFNVRIPDPD